jgi:hypothetical protein
MVSLMFPNKTMEQKLEINTIAGKRGLCSILDIIINEQNAVRLAA